MDNLSVNININSKQKSILFVASKYAILSSTAIISTQLFLLSSVNHSMAFSQPDWYYFLSWDIYGVLFALDCLLNSLCICLNFDFNQIWFLTLCCICNNCCNSLCIWMSRKCYKTSKPSNCVDFK
eukprot:215319_1